MTLNKSAALNIMHMIAPVHISRAERTNLTRSLEDSPIHQYLRCQNH